MFPQKQSTLQLSVAASFLKGELAVCSIKQRTSQKISHLFCFVSAKRKTLKGSKHYMNIKCVPLPSAEVDFIQHGHQS